jgi:two-component system sensor histidine kinase BarA
VGPAENGHSILPVGNGLRAVVAAATPSSDLILMDPPMPEVNSFEATARIGQAKLPFGRHTPIIAMIAHAMHDNRENRLRRGFDGPISKPVDLQALAKMIEQSRSHPVV